MNRCIAPWAVIAATLLAGCGGSGSTSPITIAEIDAAGAELIDILNQASRDELTFQAPDTLQAAGSATFQGLLIGSLRRDLNTVYIGESIIGRAALTTDFTDASASGSVTDLILIQNGDSFLNTFEDTELQDYPSLPEDGEVTPLEGGLTFTGGRFVGLPGSELFDVDLEGTITLPARLSGAEEASEFPVNGDVFGRVTTEGQFIADGDLQMEDGTTAYGLDTVLFLD